MVTTPATGFNVGTDKAFIQVAQYDSNKADGNVNVYVSDVEAYNDEVTLTFAFTGIQGTSQSWGSAGAGYSPASVVFSTKDRATGQALNPASTATVAPDGQSVTLTPPDVVQIQIIPSTDPAQAASGNDTWQMVVTGTDTFNNVSSAPVTVLVQLGCPYQYGISFTGLASQMGQIGSGIGEGASASDSFALSDSVQKKLYYQNGLFWVFFSQQASGGNFNRFIGWSTSSDGVNWTFQGPIPTDNTTANNDNFWDVVYDIPSSSFLFAVVDNTGSVGIWQGIPNNDGTMNVISPFTSVPGTFTPTNGSATYPSIASSGLGLVWVVVSTTDSLNASHMEFWNFASLAWTKKLDQTVITSGMSDVLNWLDPSNPITLVVTQGGPNQSIVVFNTSDGGNTWSVPQITSNTYLHRQGTIVPYNGDLYYVMPSIGDRIYFFTYGSGLNLQGQLSPELQIASGYNSCNLAINTSNSNLFVPATNNNSVVLIGSTDGGVTWSAPQVVSKPETGLISSSIHSIPNTYTNALSHTAIELVWLDYDFSNLVATYKSAALDLSNWPNLPTVIPVNTLNISHGTSKLVTGFVYPIGVSSTSSGAPTAQLSVFDVFNGDYYGVTFSPTVVKFSQPISVDSPPSFSVTLTAPSSAPSGLSFPYTLILAFTCDDGQNNANIACQNWAYLAVTVT